MTEKKSRSNQASDLLQRAEEKAGADEDKTLKKLPRETARKVLHELRVHQIELEMQNEELRQAQAELEASRERYFDLYDLAPVGYATLSEKDLILEANLTLAALLGVGRGALIKLPLPRFILPEDQDIYYRHRNQLLETGQPQVCEVRMLANAGPFWTRLEATTAQNAEGVPVCRVAISDITEHKLVEEKQRQSDEQYKTLFDEAMDGICLADLITGEILDCNQALAALVGRDRTELIGQSQAILHPPANDGEALSPEFRQHLGNKKKRILEAQVVRRDGEIRLVEIKASLLNLRGRAVLQGIFRDITEQKRAEEALRESEGRVRRKLDAILSPEGDVGALDLADVIDIKELQHIMDDVSKITHFSNAIIDLHGNILVAAGWQDVCTKFHRVHPLTCKHCLENDVTLSSGMKQGEFKAYKCKNNLWEVVMPIVVGGTHLGNLFLGQFFYKDEPLDYDVFRAQARQYGFDEEEYLAALDRVPRWSREEVNSAMDFYARLATLVSTLSYGRIKLSRALMEREQSKEQLEQYTAALETANKALKESELLAETANRTKSKFLANMSHELRTPLNAVIGFSEGLLERTDIHPLNEHQKDRLEKIKTNGEYLLQLINGVLDIAKVESGKIDLRITTFEVEPVVREVSDMAEALAKDKPAVRFALDLEGHLPPITSDRDKVRQILINLLGNAIKFTEQGSVTLRVRGDKSSLAFSVEDTGVGISAKNLEHLFEQFYQVNQETGRSLKGTGLGLAISKAFATLLYGTLMVESFEGQGSTFTFTVPLVFDGDKRVACRRVVQQAPAPRQTSCV